MNGGTVALLVVFGLCVVLSAFLSGSETAIVAVPRQRIHQLSQQGGRGRRLAALSQDLERTLGTLLVANNFVNILAASLATTLTIDAIASVAGKARGEALGPWISTAVVTALILVFGEVTPKTLAARHPDRFALAVAPAIWRLNRLLTPVTKVFVGAGRAILRLFGHDTSRAHEATEADILALAALSEQAGVIAPAEREILEALFDLADRPIRDVMTPRLEVVALGTGTTVEQAEQAMSRHRHSRFPVVAAGGTLDDLVGIIYVKDLVGRATGTDTVERFVREPAFLPESTSVLSALQRLRRLRFSFAVVVDEHGGVEGVLTVKDLVSELVGEIQDEYDPELPSLVRLGRRVFLVDGRVAVEDVEEELGIDLPEGPYATMGGLFLAATGRIPEVGDKATISGLLATVVRMHGHRIDRLRLEAEAPPDPAPADRVT